MMIENYTLTLSQQAAVNKYVRDGYVIIESGRDSGKTLTLCNIVNAWSKRAGYRDNCIIICKSISNIDAIKWMLINIFRNDSMFSKFSKTNDRVIFQMINGNIVIINFVIGIENYFYNKTCGKYNGINVSLLAGDECYIDPDWCTHTACAYTRCKDITSLSYDNVISKDTIEQMRKIMRKEDFDKEYGQYL